MMTALTTSAQGTGARVDLIGTIHSEWIKFRGLTSNIALAGFALLLLIANGVAMPWAYVFRDRGSPQADYDAYAEMIVDKTGYVGVVLAVLAVLLVTNEYRSGQIRTTLLSIPSRVPALMSKATIIAAVSFVIGVISSLIGFAVAPTILTGGGYSYQLEAPDALRLIGSSGLYLATLSIIGIAIGSLIRNVVASVLTTIVFLVVAPVIPQMFSEYGTEITRFFPIQAGSFLLAPHGTDPMGPWGGYLVLAAWTITLFTAAAITLKRRDA
ncbi:ABC transporter permease [Microbacterium sp. NPDC087591]|uniref:ABC transporter permease n=1 Tax=Microbacterium sp. NPDC087591 TaxID=3364192 RepID=UPI0038006ED0